MTAVPYSDAGLKELGKSFLPFKYIALDSSATAQSNSVSSPISEIKTNGGARAMATTASHDSGTGIVTISKQFVFTGALTVKAVCLMNNATVGQGIGLYRHVPEAGVLPDSFASGGSLVVTTTHQMTR